MDVVIIGTGNVAATIGEKILEAGHRILQVAGRREEPAALLAGALGAAYTTAADKLDRSAALYLFCVSDTALPAIAGEYRLPGSLVLHTAGAVPKEVLLPVSEDCGVLYPLQSLRKEIRPIPPIPLLVEVNQAGSLQKVLDFARTISASVQQADGEARLKLHLSAVLVNNFSNHLYTLADGFCGRQGLDFSLLLPIIRETADRLSRYRPMEVQTGPAIRGDGATIDRHLSILNRYQEKDIRQVYELFTAEIGNYYRNRGTAPDTKDMDI